MHDPNEVMNRSHRLSLMLHRAVADELTEDSLSTWIPQLRSNLDRLRNSVRGTIHHSNLDRWEHLIEAGDATAIRIFLSGVDAMSIQMREVSPFSGVLGQERRREITSMFFVADRGRPILARSSRDLG